MASIIKRKYKGKKGETTKYYIAYRDIYGKQHTVGGYSGLQDAKKHLNDFDESYTSDSEITLKTIFDIYWKKTKKYAKSTQILYNMYYEKYFKPIENIKYKKLTSVFLQDIFDNIESDSPYIANICLKFCKSAANTSIKKRIISINKFNDVDPIKLPKPDKKHLLIDDIRRILDIAKNNFKNRYYVMLFVYVGTGMRGGEIVALNVSDYNSEGKYFTVNKQFTHGELKPKPKTDSSIRKVYIFEDLANVLEDYIEGLHGEILFPNEVGGYMNIDNFRRRFWASLKQLAGISEDLRLHDLRGSYIDMVLSSGLSPKFAQNQVGHARIQTTLDVYAQNNSDMIENATTKINTLFRECCRNVVEKSKNKKSNILQFPKMPDMLCF